jgi:hypothetical protein
MGIKTPVTVDGVNVIDAEGKRIALCGKDDGIARTGPGIAKEIAAALNGEEAPAPEAEEAPVEEAPAEDSSDKELVTRPDEAADEAADEAEEAEAPKSRRRSRKGS